MIEKEILNIAEQIKKSVPVEKIYLFGSYARGTQSKDSDYDFFVVIPDDSIRPMEAMQTIYQELAKCKMQVPVDVLASTERKFNERKEQKTLEQTIEREGILLYERQFDLQMV